MLQDSKAEKDRESISEENKKAGITLDSRPSIDEGITLVKKPERVPVFQALVAEELDYSSGSAVWIDVKNESSTYALSSTGSRELMDRVYIGRAFTPFQHNQLVQDIEKFVEEDTELLVLPNFSFLYLEGQVNEYEARELFESSWRKIKEVQEKYGLKVVISMPDDLEEFNYIVEVECDRKLDIEENSKGLRYSSEDFDQMMYRDKGLIQTTIPFWQRKTQEKVELAVKQR